MADSRTRITIETERTLVVARRPTARGWCRVCGREVAVSVSDEAGRLLDAARREAAGQDQSHLHRRWAKDGLVACLKALLGLLQSQRERARS
jgi:hypothetical protein